MKSLGSICARAIFIIFFASVLGLIPYAMAARWYEDYQIAVKKIEAGECSQEAINYLGAAIVDKPKPRRGVRTIGVQTIDYLPYYHLARAHLLCGNLKSARENLEKSRQWGVAEKQDLDRLEALIREAEAARAPTSRQPSEEEFARRLESARQSVAASQKAKAACEQVLHQVAATGVQEGRWQSQLQSASQTLERAEQAFRLGSSQRDLLALADADRLAAEARLTFAELQREAEGALAARPSVVPTPTEVPTPIPRITPTPTPATPRTPPTPPVFWERLGRAVDLYVLRDYEGVLQVLRVLEDGPPKARAAQLLLRGAAALALTRLQPANSGALKEKGLQDLREARKLAPDLRPDRKVFPPWVLKEWAREN